MGFCTYGKGEKHNNKNCETHNSGGVVMTLKAVLETLDNLDEGIKSLYVEHDGKYRLDIEGGFKTNDEITGLTSALNKEREARSRLEKQVKQWEGIEDPQKAREALETLKNLDSKKLIDAGKVDEVKEEVRKAMQGKLDEMGRVVETLKATVEQKEATIRDELIGGRFVRSRFIADKLAVPVELVRAHWGARFKVEDGNVVGHDKHGNPIYSKEKPGELADFDEALSLMVDEYSDKGKILKGANATGPGMHTTGHGYNIKSEWQNLSPEERIEYGRQRQKQ